MSIAVEKLCFSYFARSVLVNISFLANNGQLLAVIGPNGAGKTTLFRCILGLQSGYTGTITVDDCNVRSLSARKLAHRIAYIPQTNRQAFNYSVLDMVLMGTSHLVSIFSTPGQRELDAAKDALARVGIITLAEKSYAHLSGGEQQLVLIARALAQQVKIFLMDEPTSNLDYGNQTRVLEQVRSLASDGYTILLSTHNPQHAFWYADAVLALRNERVAAFGKPSDIISPELIYDLYGVDVQFIETDNGSVLAPVSRRRADLCLYGMRI